VENSLHIRLLGPLAVLKDGVEQSLPASRKVRALLAFLAVAPGTTTRSRLCELFWDTPSDPRGELRWSLSKLRGLLDRRVLTKTDAIGLDLSGCDVDAARVMTAIQAGVESLEPDELRELDALFVGDFAEGLELDRNPEFASWLGAQRRQFRAHHVAVLEQLVTRVGDTAYLERWLQLAPFDERPHERLLRSLASLGRLQEGEEHLKATIRVFEAEGLSWVALREAWRAARSRVPSPAVPIQEPTREVGQRPSICVMPFVDRTTDCLTPAAVMGDGLTDDIITRLAKLRALFVIARGSVYSLRERNVPATEAAQLLGVNYVASGSLRRHRQRVTVSVELVEAATARIIWADEFASAIDDAPAIQDAIVNRVVASIAEEVEAAERERALLRPPDSLNAWEAYHRGLWHMYRFNETDNERAAHFFRDALRQDRRFARAHAGLSFTHFQNAFLHRPAQRDAEIERAFETAGESLVADDRDPAAHWAMGRALWLRGSGEEALRELEQSVALSPNFVLGHYTLGFVHGQSGDARLAIASADHSRHLSPFDPMMFAMYTTRAIALIRLGQFSEAAEWAVRGAARPNAHVHIRAIAASCLALAGRLDEAGTFVTSTRKAVPDYRIEDLLRSFRFEPQAAALFNRCAARIGLD
jgi:TolB-like protein/DNA-binding SARP family transcriptional activator